MNVFGIIFFITISFIIFTYAGYPISLLCFKFLRRIKVDRQEITPALTMIITVFNEETRITQKIENSLKLDYPPDLLQIIVASDGSTDKTNEIVSRFENDRIQLLPIPVRNGKDAAQKEALKLARGDVIVFSDVATEINAQGLKKIVANFADPSIGCVSSVDKIISESGEVSGENAYVKYEMWLRSIESEVNSLVGLSGSYFAARREVCEDWAADMQSDFRTLLNSIKLGLRGVSDPEVIGYYPDIKNPSKEFERKVRTILRGITVVFRNLEYLNIFKYGLFSYQYFSHKIMRWMIPWFLIAALFTNIIAALNNPIFQFILFFHSMFYLLALIGLLNKKVSNFIIIKIPMFFTMANYSILVAWIKYFRGTRSVLWTPTKR